MIKSNGKVTRKTRESYFFHRKPQKLKIAKIIFRKMFSKKNEKFHSVSRLVSKLRKLASYRRNTKIKEFPLQLGKDKSKLSFLRTSWRFYSALVILEPQIYVDLCRTVRAENISLLSGRLVIIFRPTNCVFFSFQILANLHFFSTFCLFSPLYILVLRNRAANCPSTL